APLGSRFEFLVGFESCTNAAPLAPGLVECEQFMGENSSLRFVTTIEIGRDLWRRCPEPRRLPRLLEPIADRINTRGGFERKLFIRACLAEAHPPRSSSSCFQSNRMRLSLRSMVRGTQSSRAAISSLVHPSTFHNAIWRSSGSARASSRRRQSS